MGWLLSPPRPPNSRSSRLSPANSRTAPSPRLPSTTRSSLRTRSRLRSTVSAALAVTLSDAGRRADRIARSKPAAHLLKYDSILGTFKSDVKVIDDKTISVDGDIINVVAERDPLKLPWKEMGIDIVIEGTGVFLDGPGAGKHLTAGAKKVVITAPAKGNDIPTY